MRQRAGAGVPVLDQLRLILQRVLPDLSLHIQLLIHPFALIKIAYFSDSALVGLRLREVFLVVFEYHVVVPLLHVQILLTAVHAHQLVLLGLAEQVLEIVVEQLAREVSPPCFLNKDRSHVRRDDRLLHRVLLVLRTILQVLVQVLLILLLILRFESWLILVFCFLGRLF